MQFSRFALSIFFLAVALTTVPAFTAVVSFTETFDTGTSNWLNGASVAPDWHSNGGIDDSGYISYTVSFTSGESGPFGSPPLVILSRANAAADASGDAFVGSWLDGGILYLKLSVRHNYDETLNLYARIDAGSGNAASLAFDAEFEIAPNTWTTIDIPIVDNNPPFSSYGAGTFNGVFNGVQNLQFGLYLPPETTFTDLTFDIDNVAVAVPEPSVCAVIGLGLGVVLLRHRRTTKSSF